MKVLFCFLFLFIIISTKWTEDSLLLYTKTNINTINPKGLISLTLPKKGVSEFKGKHFLAGRFVPHKLYEVMKINVNDNLYKDSELYTLL